MDPVLFVNRWKIHVALTTYKIASTTPSTMVKLTQDLVRYYSTSKKAASSATKGSLFSTGCYG